MKVEVFGNLVAPNKLEVTIVNNTPSGKGYIVEDYDDDNTGYFNPETGKMWTEEDLADKEVIPKKTVEEQLEELREMLASVVKQSSE